MTFQTMHEAYMFALDLLLRNGRTVHGPKKYYEFAAYRYDILDSTQDRIDWNRTGLPSRQPIYTGYLEREFDWYQSGSLDAATAPSKFWNKLADKTGMIQSNYGRMILHETQYPGPHGLGITALEHVLRLLRADHTSRQAVIHYNLPRHNWPGCKDVPCTMCAQVLIRDDMLVMIVYQRSCDVWLGMPYDVPWHCWLIRHLATLLRVKPGPLTHMIGSFHLYEKDVPAAKKTLTL